MNKARMNIFIPKSYWRIFLLVFFDVAFCVSIVYAYILFSSFPPNQWIIGDWLINYQGGVVRRGLPGEIFLQISQALGVNIVALVVAFQILIYSVFLVKAYKLSINSVASALTTTLILSPAFILFPILDPQGSFRKEILLFALLSALCCHLAYSHKDNSGWLLVYIGAVSVFIVLSHEMLVVYLPYVFCAFVIYEKGLGVTTKKAAISMIPAIIIAIFLIIFGKGDKQIVNSICHSLGTYAPPDCAYLSVLPGSISFLGKDLSSAHNYVLYSIGETTILAYVLTAILSSTPLVLIFFSKQIKIIRENKEMRQWLVIGIFSTVIGSIPLCWVVADYGRLIYIHVTCLTLLALLMSQDKNNISEYCKPEPITTWILCSLFIVSWRLIHFKASIDNAFPLIKSIFERLF
jgi:hypothetical protein